MGDSTALTAELWPGETDIHYTASGRELHESAHGGSPREMEDGRKEEGGRRKEGTALPLTSNVLTPGAPQR
jgi:hypothetical protein